MAYRHLEVTNHAAHALVAYREVMESRDTGVAR